MIKVFNLTSIPGGDPVDYTRDGIVLGWGLRNSVGLAANPSDGGIWSVENSADQIQRGGYDIHKDDPGEELNYHGNLSDVGERGPNYGYVCSHILVACSVR
jgi:glucose/arabinose dehydrogenase